MGTTVCEDSDRVKVGPYLSIYNIEVSTSQHRENGLRKKILKDDMQDYLTSELSGHHSCFMFQNILNNYHSFPFSPRFHSYTDYYLEILPEPGVQDGIGSGPCSKVLAEMNLLNQLPEILPNYRILFLALYDTYRCDFVFQTGSAMTGVRSNDDSDNNNFSDDESTPLYGGR